MSSRSSLTTAWTVGDQGVSSATNVVFTLSCARVLKAADFGLIAVMQTGYALALGVSASFGAFPLLFRYAADGTLRLTEQVPRVARLVLASALLLWPAAIVVLYVGRGAGARAGAILFLGLPFLLAQDLLRYFFISIKKSSRAFWMDLVWLLCTTALVGYSVRSGHKTSDALMGCWVAGGVASAVMGLTTSGINLFRRREGWLRDNGRQGGQLLLEMISANATTYVSLLFLGVVAGPTQVGRVRVAQTLLGPLTTAAQAANLVATPRVAAQARDVVKLRQGTTRWTVVQVGLAASWTIVIVLLPSRIGTFILKDAWIGTRVLTTILGLSAVVSALSFGALVGLRSLGRAGSSARLRLGLAVPSVVVCVLGASWRGANGYAYGCVLSAFALAVAARGTFRAQSARVLVN